jgi:ABC-2 type transport system permease protein
MIRLVSAELLRARSRHVIRVLMVGVAVGVVISMGIATWNSAKSSADESYRSALASCMRGEFVPPDQLPPQYHSLAEFCADQVRPEDYGSNQLRWADLGQILNGTSSIVILLGVLLGATLGGADWTAGSMSTLLTWEPRRIRVLSIRTAVAAFVAFVFTVAAQAFFVLIFRLGVAIAGTTAGVEPGMLRHAAGTGLRVALVAALFAVVAHALATLGRSTVAAVGILFGYLVIFEGFVSNLWIGLQPRLLIRAAVVVISHQPLYDPRVSATFGPNGELTSQLQRVLLSVAGAWVVLFAWAIGLLLVALFAFRVRDVN